MRICPYAWLAQNVENDNSFIKKITENIRRHYLEAWQTYIFKTTSKMCGYTQCRHAYAQMRSGFYELKIEKGPYNNTPIADHLCKMCNLCQVKKTNCILF